MVVDWSGNNKETLWLYLTIICCGSNYEKELEPFHVLFSLGIVDSKGVTKLEEVSLTQIGMLREDYFTISPPQNESKDEYGFDLSDSCLINNCISIDMLTMKCILTPL